MLVCSNAAIAGFHRGVSELLTTAMFFLKVFTEMETKSQTEKNGDADLVAGSLKHADAGF